MPPTPVPTSPLKSHRRQLRASRRVREWRLAERAAGQILDLRPDDRRAVAARAWIAHAQGDSMGIDAGLVELAQKAEARGLFRDRNRLLLRRAFLHDQLGAPALGLFRHALEQAAASGDARAAFLAWQGIVGAAVRGGDPGELAEALDGYLAAAAAAGAEGYALQVTSGVAAGSGPQAAVAARALARRAAGNGELDVAAGWLRELVRRGPADAAAAGELETFCLAHARWTELADLYRIVAGRAAGAERAEALSRLAELLEDELDRPLEAAEAWAAAAPELGVAAVREELRIHQERGDRASARRALDRAIAGAPGRTARAEALLLRASFLRAQKEAAAAEADLARALREDPACWPALAERAELAAARGEAAVAEPLERALREAELPPDARVGLLRCLARLSSGPLGRPAEARRAWEQVHAEDPEDREAASFLREAYRASGERDALVELLRRDLSRDPQAAEAPALRRELARCLDESGRGDEALAEWRRLWRAEPTAADAFEAIQGHCASAGRWREAVELFDAAAQAQVEPRARAELLDRQAEIVGERLGDAARADLLRAKAAALRGAAG